jgi:sugar O-acyltransferase (sialic acid O-acetyltransferase NeuD family)
MTVPLIVVGAGGFGRETLDVVQAMNAGSGEPPFELLGVVDSAPSDLNLMRLAARGVPWLGTIPEWLAGRNSAMYLIGVGNPVARQRIDHQFSSAGLLPATAVHPSSTVGTGLLLGAGSIICGGVQVSTNVTLGRHVHLNPNCTVGHDSTLGDYASVNPAATVSGDVTVESEVLVGAGAVILQGLHIGRSAVVGASACVVRDVATSQTVKGVPAR